jgi:predicted flap endonuclease-1-like 5' DNA nuclease/uncharacterized protein (DUF3084 family)
MDTRMQEQANVSTDYSAVSGDDLQALRKELAKWQARVPKLVAALKEKTREADQLKVRLKSTGNSANEGSESGIRVRDALIEELEAKLKALGSKHQDSEGQLHARDLEITSLRQEVSEWREKWQAVSTSLDAQAGTADRKDRELKRLQGEIDELLGLQGQHNARVKEQDLELTGLREKCQSLENRNRNLFETTELANRQIETLGENLEHLRSELKKKNEDLAGRDKAADGTTRELEELKRQIASRDQDIEFLHGNVEEKRQEISRLEERAAKLAGVENAMGEADRERERLEKQLADRTAEIDMLSGRIAELENVRKEHQALSAALEEKDRETAGKVDELEQLEEDLGVVRAELESERQENRRLEECVAGADEASSRWEMERRGLSEQMEELMQRNEHLEYQLTERSDLVVGLEQEKTAINDRTASLEQENARLSDALEKARRSSAENADHIAHVDARLERQMQLVENLEQELAQVQEEYADAVKAHQSELTGKLKEIAALEERLGGDSVDAVERQLAEKQRQLSEKDQRLAELNGELTESRQALHEAKKSARDHQTEVEGLRQRLEEQSGQDATARSQLAEKVEKLEVQLRKQSRATAEAEELLASARSELEEARQTVSQVPEEVSGENRALQAEIIKLEGMVRERTEQLNKLRWQQDMIEKQAGEGSDSKMLLVLNQQLASAREDNARLLEKVRVLESEAAAPSADSGTAPASPTANPSADAPTDDLTQIRGIGPKLVKTLTRLGITRFDQIAMLSSADLDDEDHPLNGMRGRILKDGWIEQAARLGG